MRSIWKGHLQFSLVTIPIRIYNAVNREETIRFNQLHKVDNGPVGYDKKCKRCGKTLTAEEIEKGYQFEPMFPKPRMLSGWLIQPLKDSGR